MRPNSESRSYRSRRGLTVHSAFADTDHQHAPLLATDPNDQWVFGDRDSGACLLRFSWTKIVRHQMVRGTSSRDDPALTQYWADRRRRGIPRPMDIVSLRLLQTQNGACPSCGELLLDADRPPQSPREWEQWLTVTRKAMTHNAIVRADGTPDEAKFRLLHAHCHRQYARNRSSPAALPAREP